VIPSLTGITGRGDPIRTLRAATAVRLANTLQVGMQDIRPGLEGTLMSTG
jgi:hypothetical protein